MLSEALRVDSHQGSTAWESQGSGAVAWERQGSLSPSWGGAGQEKEGSNAGALLPIVQVPSTARGNKAHLQAPKLLCAQICAPSAAMCGLYVLPNSYGRLYVLPNS